MAGYCACRFIPALHTEAIVEFATFPIPMVWSEKSDLYAVGKILGHSSVVSSQRYAHLANDTLLAAVEAGASKMSPRV